MTTFKKLRISKSKNKKFIEACKNGDLNLVQLLLDQNNVFFADIHTEHDEGFRSACQNGNLEIVKYLLTSEDLQEHADIHALNDSGFRYACAEGHLNIIQYLLTSPDLKEHAKIHADHDDGFRWACIRGHLDVVKYLLTSPNLKDHAAIHVENDAGFRWACWREHVDVVRYLLTSPDLVEHANIHCFNESLSEKIHELNVDILIYLLSFNGSECVNFQQTQYNLNWAVEHQHDDVVIAMMQNLKNNDFMQYIDCLPKIEEYNKELYEHVKNIAIDNDEISGSPSETVLFL